MSQETATVELADVAKTFTMHLRGGAKLPVVEGVTFAAAPGECIVLGGPSGAGKSSVLKMIYGNYRTDRGSIRVRADADAETEWTDIAQTTPRRILALRTSTIGYVSQFLRTIPRVGARDIVASAARNSGASEAAAGATADELLTRLNVPRRLWDLAPASTAGVRRANRAASPPSGGCGGANRGSTASRGLRSVPRRTARR